VLEDIECNDSYDSNLEESTFLVTPLSNSNKDECFTPSDDIELLLHHDPSISIVFILEGFTDEPPLEGNDDLFDLESKENDWKKILYDALIDDLITKDKDFPDYKDSHAWCFVHRSLDLRSLACLYMGIRYPRSYRLTSKSTSWDQFGTNIASALVGLATNQKFNFSKLIFDGMLRNLKDSKPFLMYPRFIQLFLNKQLEGSTKPQNFLPTVVLPPKVFTFMSKCSPKFSGKLTPLTPPMLEVATAVRAEHSLHTEELDITTSSHPEGSRMGPPKIMRRLCSHHSDDSLAGKKAESPSLVASERPASPNDYTPTNEVQISRGDEGNLDLYRLTRAVLRLKKQNTKQAAQILRLKTKLKILVK
ncbi:hypothetical protein Tco_1414305, partial [Tanacetum coccineum]